MTREEAIETIRRCCPKVGDSQCYFESALRELIPELRESEDERIINQLITLVNSSGEILLIPTNKEELIAWLNNCKESLHVSETCKENADSFTDEDERIRKELIEQVGYILPDKEEYDDEGRVLPTYHKRIGRYRAYLEKQKEQKPADYNEYKMLIDGAREDGRIKGRKEVIDHPDEYGLTKQKPTEWSEEDEKQIAQIERIVKNAGCAKMLQEKIHNWLKSIRPQPRWKPSEEQMTCLCAVVDAAIRKHNESVSGYKLARVLKSLYEQLKKL